MVKQLRKVGNSSAVILDRAIMELIGLEANGEVQLTVRNGALLLTPVRPKPVSSERFEECLSRVVAKRRSTLRRLAE
jgi:antitoxin component of MazEF toxin-antitoxin module